MLWTLACGTTSNDQQPLQLEPVETATVLQVTPVPMVPPTNEPQGAANSKATPEATSTKTLLPTPDQRAMQAPTEEPTNAASPTAVQDGTVYVAPKVVPTETPPPTPTATPDPGAKPTTIWDRHSREEYLAMIPNPALGVSWGQVVENPKGDHETTPEGIKHWGSKWGVPSNEMVLILEERIAQGITGVAVSGGHKLLGTNLFAKRRAVQWEWVHPKIPLARMIIEYEFYTEANPRELTVWRGGAHMIMKDSYEQRGKVWVTVLEPELIGPVVVEETNCAGMLMPWRAFSDIGHQCSR